ncbi:NADP-dependent phosphogluconate dehydrogenase [Arenibacterium halophilum]|uniref:6-phosphogluconate dehydrogenase, decarboxylating n=1 Tax=Arenibacterium halophilum TaxID=2583821 RepID=A0ABY2XA70_9RHOB|nr:NADP-dependent phosphogluconate dehydrogenase [Arenibacterium halophilum]TMV12864.1 NADP-dependent phosphogluconate dehydrogenase [Arenibacterium halophilum]
MAKQAQIGVYGLGTMGSALALNLAERGNQVAVANREVDWLAPFVARSGDLAARIVPCETAESFVAALARPRVVVLMIPSGAPVDQMIDTLRPLLESGDMIVDAGNSDFHDTRRRSDMLASAGLHYVGMGVSGGAEGARHGPSMMVGGSEESWTRLRPLLEPSAARFGDDACIAHVGPDGAGHFVKTVHNGIEYADMQLIAEVYGLLRDGGGWGADRIAGLFESWNDGPLKSYLVATTAKVLAARDPATGNPVVDIIRDSAGQKGTGRWTVIEALRLGQSASVIEAAVGARGWSSDGAARQAASDVLGTPATAKLPARQDMEHGLLAARILAHAQGFRVMSVASDEFGWGLDLARVAEIWRAGCIIRSALLDDIAAAMRSAPPHGHLILAPQITATLRQVVPGLRRVVGWAMTNGLPVPALSAALAWHDSMRRARGSANLIQAQRDFFGAHGFQRIDSETGGDHGPWHTG